MCLHKPSVNSQKNLLMTLLRSRRQRRKCALVCELIIIIIFQLWNPFFFFKHVIVAVHVGMAGLTRLVNGEISVQE